MQILKKKIFAVPSLGNIYNGDWRAVQLISSIFASSESVLILIE